MYCSRICCKQLAKQSKCDDCKNNLLGSAHYGEQPFFHLFFCGGLTIASSSSQDFVSCALAILDLLDGLVIQYHKDIQSTLAGECTSTLARISSQFARDLCFICNNIITGNGY